MPQLIKLEGAQRRWHLRPYYAAANAVNVGVTYSTSHLFHGAWNVCL